MEREPDRGELRRPGPEGVIRGDPAVAVGLDDADAVQVHPVMAVRQVTHVVLPRQHVPLQRLQKAEIKFLAEIASNKTRTEPSYL